MCLMLFLERAERSLIKFKLENYKENSTFQLSQAVLYVRETKKCEKK